MKLLHQITGAVFRRMQSLTLYRRIGRRAAVGVALREATDADQLAVHHWFDPNGDPAQSMDHDTNVTNWVAEYHGQLVGYVQLVRHPLENAPYIGYWLFSLYIKSRWQGLGIGEALSRAVIERARKEGAPMLDLVVYQDNFRAIQLYRKLNFESHIIPELERQFESERLSTGRGRAVMRKRLM